MCSCSNMHSKTSSNANNMTSIQMVRSSVCHTIGCVGIYTKFIDAYVFVWSFWLTAQTPTHFKCVHIVCNIVLVHLNMDIHGSRVMLIHVLDPRIRTITFADTYLRDSLDYVNTYATSCKSNQYTHPKHSGPYGRRPSHEVFMLFWWSMIMVSCQYVNKLWVW
jgi:hypothetical protein